MSNPRRIYVDLDDVLCETARTFVDLLRRDYGKEVDFEDIRWFDLSRSFDLDRNELNAFMKTAHSPEVLSTMAPVEGALPALTSWVEAGYEVEVVTGRPPATFEASQSWLEEAKMPHHGLTYADKYSRQGWVDAGPPMVPLSELAQGGFCVAIEDSADMARYLSEELEIPVLLIDRPWNRHLEQPSGTNGRIHRCNGWQEIVDRFPQP